MRLVGNHINYRNNQRIPKEEVIMQGPESQASFYEAYRRYPELYRFNSDDIFLQRTPLGYFRR